MLQPLRARVSTHSACVLFVVPVAESQRQPVGTTVAAGVTQNDHGLVIGDQAKQRQVLGDQLETIAPVVQCHGCER